MTSKMIEITCPECGGDGTVWVLDWLYWNGDQDDHEEQCPECFGNCTILVDADEYYTDHPEETPEGYWEDEE